MVIEDTCVILYDNIWNVHLSLYRLSPDKLFGMFPNKKLICEIHENFLHANISCFTVCSVSVKNRLQVHCLMRQNVGSCYMGQVKKNEATGKYWIWFIPRSTRSAKSLLWQLQKKLFATLHMILNFGPFCNTFASFFYFTHMWYSIHVLVLNLCCFVLPIPKCSIDAVQCSVYCIYTADKTVQLQYILRMQYIIHCSCRVPCMYTAWT